MRSNSNLFSTLLGFAVSFLLVANMDLPLRAQDSKPVEPKKTSSTVFLCGSGPAPHFENMTDGILAALAESKIVVKASDGSTRSTCREKAKEAGATTLLYMVATVSERNASETNLSIQCFDSEGTKLWEEVQKGPLFSSSVASTIKTVTEKMVKKIKTHIGQPGLSGN